MNFFKLYIGDYQRDTAHLSITENGAYLLMLQHYYATEKPLPIGNSLYRMLRAVDPTEREAIDSIAKQFWTETSDGLINERANEEIAKANVQAETNRRITVEREAKRTVSRPFNESLNESLNESFNESSTNRTTNRVPDRDHDRSTINEPIQTPDTRLRNTPPNPHRGKVHEFPPGFDRFWEAYPRKTSKPAAARAFTRIRVDDGLLASMLAAVERERRSEQWTRDNGKFIPHPATWLNNRRWEDEPAVGVRHTDDIFAGAV